MQNLRENINYSDSKICPKCQSQIVYHVTDIKGIDEKFIICTNCHSKVPLN